MNILIVEDDFYNRMMVAHLMRNEGHTVQEVDNPEGAFEMIQRSPPHLILLDVNFGPKHLTGFQFFERLKKKEVDVPVIFMTTRADLEDKLEGFKIGADDYITKPYAPAEVAARVKSVLVRVYKRTGLEQQQRLRYDTVELDVAALQVHIAGRKPIDLTKTEMRMLMHLMQRAEQVVPREDLLNAVWHDDFYGDSNIVDSYIRKLRRKLEADPANPTLIRTVRGSGYKFSTKK
ncbi:MAG: response regulator transcription factor [Ktedonobacterales bacterium]|nr:response regulator transcription factor [Ktedonobacterales bacterium]